MATKKEREQQREHARLLYMQGEPQKSIAGKVGVSAQTVTRWVADGGWTPSPSHLAVGPGSPRTERQAGIKVGTGTLQGSFLLEGKLRGVTHPRV